MKDIPQDNNSDIARTYGDELAPGTLLCHGQYTIKRYINSGGFGVTYLTSDSLARKVVIKECFPNAMCCRAGELVRLRSRSYVQDFEQVVELFEKEARALAQLQHPNIVGVHQIFKDNGTAYMALDFVDGLDLLDVLETQPELLNPDDIKRLLLKLLEALSYVHSNGILHRDISPDNILLDQSLEPVLIDFGAARESATRASRVLSRVHTVKDGYSPQEFYFAGSEQSASSDLYALAATFYHLIAGEPPTNSNVRLGAVAENCPDPYEQLSGRFPAFDARFLESIDQCLNLFAKDRIASAAIWRDEIDDVRRYEVHRAQIENDHDIETKIARLVEQNRRALAEAADKPAAVKAEETGPQKEDPKTVAERKYWATLREDLSDFYDTVEEPGADAEAAVGIDVSDNKEPVEKIVRPVRPVTRSVASTDESKVPQEPTSIDEALLSNKFLREPNLDGFKYTSGTANASQRKKSLASLLTWSANGKTEAERNET
ncbi:MAG: serine/threonine-protein kinase [Paracoccaceae bacterium]